jgi:hypothetical protein
MWNYIENKGKAIGHRDKDRRTNKGEATTTSQHWVRVIRTISDQYGLYKWTV